MKGALSPVFEEFVKQMMVEGVLECLGKIQDGDVYLFLADVGAK